MANNPKQIIADIIQANESIVRMARQGLTDDAVGGWMAAQSTEAQARIKEAKKALKDNFNIDYDSDAAKKQVIKEGSTVKVLVNHMDGMKGSMATVKGYSSPAMLADIKMSGMDMSGHKWLTNAEVSLP